MPDESYQGTGDRMFELELPEQGTFYFRDDGDPDTYVHTAFEWPDGSTCSIGSALKTLRENMGDQPLIDALEASAGQTTTQSTPRSRRGRFICDECGLTWPAKRDQTPESHTTICPECFEEEEA